MYKNCVTRRVKVMETKFNPDVIIIYVIYICKVHLKIVYIF